MEAYIVRSLIFLEEFTQPIYLIHKTLNRMAVGISDYCFIKNILSHVRITTNIGTFDLKIFVKDPPIPHI